MFKDAASEEMEWADYLFKGGSMLGLNAEILKKYMMHLTNRRMKDIRMKPIFENTPLPINWISHWVSNKDGGAQVQTANQETESEQYLISAFEQDLDDTDFSEFNF